MRWRAPLLDCCPNQHFLSAASPVWWFACYPMNSSKWRIPRFVQSLNLLLEGVSLALLADCCYHDCPFLSSPSASTEDDHNHTLVVGEKKHMLKIRDISGDLALYNEFYPNVRRTLSCHRPLHLLCGRVVDLFLSQRCSGCLGAMASFWSTTLPMRAHSVLDASSGDVGPFTHSPLDRSRYAQRVQGANPESQGRSRGAHVHCRHSAYLSAPPFD